MDAKGQTKGIEKCLEYQASSRPKGEEVLGKTTDNIKKAMTVKIGKNRFPD